MSETLPPRPDALTADYDLLREGCGLVEPANAGLVILSGEDRKGWLQGQVTNNLRDLAVGGAVSFCLCNATGQMLAACELWSLPNRFALTTHKDGASAVRARVEQNVILEDVLATDAGPEYRLLSIQGPSATRELGALMTLPTLDAGEAEFLGTTVLCLRANRTGMGGWDLWVPTDAKRALQKLHKVFPPVGDDAVDAARLEAGIPIYGRDMNERTLPPEMGPAFETRNVSYKKGCYTGQEVLMRIHSPGHTNRCWVGLLADEPLEAGSVVSHPLRSDAGVVTSVAVSPDYGPIAGAMVRNEAAGAGDVVSVQTSNGPVEAEVRPMPLLRLS